MSLSIRNPQSAIRNVVMLAVAMLLGVSSPALAQRPRVRPDAALPTVTGKVAAYEADKSITVEVRERGGQSKKVDFTLVKDKTKVELLGTTKAIEVGAEVRVWADKDNPKAAARVSAGTPQRTRERPGTGAAQPTASGKVVAYDAGKSITVEIRQRGGEAKKVDFTIDKDKTKVELLGTTKAIEVGTEVRVWADKDNAKAAERISAGTSQRTRERPQTGAAQPTAAGKVVAYDAGKAIAVEIRQRGGEAKKVDFAIDKDKTKVELLGTTKAIEVGTDVRIWAEPNNPKAAARISAGAPQRQRP